MKDIDAILNKYWGFNSFRPFQKEVIESVLSGKDVITLFPTGGGKSICFQVPALAKKGICIVVSPLIALIQDQVDGLSKKGIKSIGLTGYHSFKDLHILFDNCIYGGYKFLYLSPEKLQNMVVQERINQMPISLIAIDEAHCVSHWGHDFRPAYLKCDILKKFFPNAPTIALTATATPPVLKDIKKHLSVEQALVMRTSFIRKNIAYKVFYNQNKREVLRRILVDNKGSAIVYATSRQATIEISQDVNRNGILASFFHGGMDRESKEKVQKQWMENKIQVMVCTNAFGMGIDKPDVRTVVHINLPESIENYYQETGRAGRAGRDGGEAKAYLLFNDQDITQVKNQFLKGLPQIEDIKLVYRTLCSYLQIAYGEGEGSVFGVDIRHFCMTHNFKIPLVYNILKLLDRHSVITFSERACSEVLLQIIVDREYLTTYVENKHWIRPIIQAILKIENDIFTKEVILDTSFVSRKMGISEKYLVQQLEDIHKDQIIEFKKQKGDVTICFLMRREDNITINPIAKKIKQHNALKVQKVDAMIAYVTNNIECKNKILLAYFGETLQDDCGICSTCETKLSEDFDQIENKIVNLLKLAPTSPKNIVGHIGFGRQKEVIENIKKLTEEGKISVNKRNEYYLT